MISKMMGSLTKKKEPAAKVAAAPLVAPLAAPVTAPVTAVILEDADGSFADGRILHVGEDGMLDLGEQDHICGVSSEVIRALPSYPLEELEKDAAPCTICQEAFAIGDILKELPCQHRFHQGCIEKWLEVSTNCPVCNKILE
mmetsp:Transcript_50950/g.81324  ORF Transcript_50950/g.81324 Transcript_50950/m.81324 type:complete len:142 (+) Transcript_50950:29-454(+)